MHVICASYHNYLKSRKLSQIFKRDVILSILRILNPDLESILILHLMMILQDFCNTIERYVNGYILRFQHICDILINALISFSIAYVSGFAH